MASRFDVKRPWAERLSGEDLKRTALEARVDEMPALPVAEPVA